MATVYTYQTTITVKVTMADEGEVSAIDGEATHWDTPEAQEESALEYAKQAMPLHDDYAEEWVDFDAPDLKLVSRDSRQA